MDHKKEGTGHDIQDNQEKHWNHEKHENHVSGADLGAGRRRSAPLPEMKPSSYSLLKVVYLTSQLRHSLVVHPLLRKILDAPF